MGIVGYGGNIIISTVDGNVNLTGIAVTDSGSDTAQYNVGTFLASGSITATGAGNITINGQGANTSGGSDWGLALVSFNIRTHNGSISLQGTGTADDGIYIGGNVLSTGTAPITLTGTGANGSSDILITSGNTIAPRPTAISPSTPIPLITLRETPSKPAQQVIFQPARHRFHPYRSCGRGGYA